MFGDAQQEGRFVSPALLVGLALGATACGPRGAPQHSPTGAPSSAEAPRATSFDEAFEEAIRLQDEALATTAPKYTGSGEKTEAMAFINGTLKPWFEQRYKQNERAFEALRRALRLAVEPEHRAAVAESHALLDLDFAQQFLQGATRAMPSAWKSDSLIATTYERALHEKATTWYERVAPSAQLCADNTRDENRRAHCLDLLKRVRQLEARRDELGADTRRDSPSVGLDKRPPVPTRPSVPTTQPRPCVFHGTLRTAGLLYEQLNSKTAFAQLDGGFGIEVDALVPSSGRTGRSRVDITFPIAMTAWLDADTVPLVVNRDVTLVPDHVWLPRGFHVAVYGVRDSTGRIFRRLTPPGAPPTAPATLDQPLSCAALALSDDINEPDHDVQGERVRFSGGRAHLHAAPGGKRVGTVSAQGAYRIEERDGWCRVRGAEPFHFDGWVSPSNCAKPASPPIGLIGLLREAVRTHDVVKPLAVRETAKRSAAVVTTLVPGSWLVAGEAHGEFVEVQVAAAISFIKHDPLTGEVKRLPLFVARTDFDSSTQAAAQ